MESFETKVTPETELVLDGFPGSGNSYLSRVIKTTQDPPIRMAHHLHASNQLVLASKRKIPALMVLRKPEDAICSTYRRFGYPLASATKLYWRFHEGLENHLDGIMVARFEDITKHPGAVLQSLGERFGLSLRCDFPKTELDGLWAIGKALEEATEEELQSKRDAKAALRDRLHQQVSAVDLERADKIYQRLSAACVQINTEG